MIEVRLFAGLRQGSEKICYMEPDGKDEDIVSLFPAVGGG